MSLYDLLIKINAPKNLIFNFTKETRIENVEKDFEKKCFEVVANLPNSLQEDELEKLKFFFKNFKYQNSIFEIIWKRHRMDSEIKNFIVKNEDIYRQSSSEYIENKPATSTTKTMLAKTSYHGTTRNSSNIDKPSYRSFLEIEDSAQNVVLHGEVINLEEKMSKTKTKIYFVTLSDFKSSIKAIYYARDNERTIFDSEGNDSIKIGDWIAVRGRTGYSEYEKGTTFTINNFKKIYPIKKTRTDQAPVKRIEFHTHTKMSVMDGVSSAEKYIEQADKWDWQGIAITDHSNVQAFPDAFKALKKINKARLINKQRPLKLVYGAEMNMLTPDWYYVKNAKHQKLNESRLVFFDLETTGLSPELDEIIEFGATLYDYKTGEIDQKDWLFRPHQPLKEFTKDLTKITDEMLINKPFAEDGFTEILDFIKNATLVAHNARFDFGFLQAYAKKLNLAPLENTVIDTLSIARSLYPHLKSHRLGVVAKKLGIFYDDKIAHRGDYDAAILNQIFGHMLNEAKQKYQLVYDDDWNNINPSELKNNPNLTRDPGFHTIVLAKNQQGLKELYQLISLSHTQNLLGGPKIFREDLKKIRLNNNILLGSGCVNGELFDAARTKTKTDLEAQIKFYDYVEIQPLSVYKHLIQNNSLTELELKRMIKTIIQIAQKNNVLVIATSDAHYVEPDIKIIRDIYINAKGLGGKRHPLFNYKNPNQENPEQHLRTTQEMIDELSWINDPKLIDDLVINNPQKLFKEFANDVEPLKQGTFEPKIDNVEKLLEEKCFKVGEKLYGNPLPENIANRLNRELKAINKHGYAVVYWISHLLVKKSLEEGYLVGSRGSVGSSLVARFSEITEVNPLPPHYRCPQCQYSNFDISNEIRCGFDLITKKCPQCSSELLGDGHNIPFETFLGYDGDKTPDIDLNFSSEYQAKAHNFVKEMFGENNAFRAGTIATVANKTAYGYVKAYFEEKDKSQMPRNVEIDRLANLAAGVKRTTGQHPGGIIILPKNYDIEDFTPINYPADDDTNNWKTTHFDFTSIHDNLLKMDILGHVDPTALKMLHELTGFDPMRIPMNDKKVYSLFTSLEALNLKPEQLENEKTGAIGLPEFGTNFVRNMLRDTKPESFADLVQISGLSHGTDVWVSNAQPLIKQGKATIATVIGCRDDIMVYLVKQGLEPKLAFNIMEAVRKGQGLKTEWKKEMKKYQVPQWYIEACEKIKYMFPKAHATAYVLMAYRIAWYKIYYPIEYYATFFTTRSDVFELQTIIKGAEAIKNRLRELNERATQKLTSVKENELINILEVALEMAVRGIKIKNIDVNKSLATTFIVEKDQITQEKVIYPPFNVINSLGEAVANSIVKGREERVFQSINDLRQRTQITQTQIKTFGELEITKSLGEEEQLSFSF